MDGGNLAFREEIRRLAQFSQIPPFTICSAMCMPQCPRFYEAAVRRLGRSHPINNDTLIPQEHSRSLLPSDQYHSNQLPERRNRSLCTQAPSCSAQPTGFRWPDHVGLHGCHEVRETVIFEKRQKPGIFIEIRQRGVDLLSPYLDRLHWQRGLRWDNHSQLMRDTARV